MKLEKFWSVLERDSWILRLLQKITVEKIERWAEKSLHHIGFQPWQDWRLDVSKNTLRWKDLGPQLSGDQIWRVILAQKYYLFGHLDGQNLFELGPLEIDEEFWGDPSLESSQGKYNVRQAIEIWSRNLLGVDKKILKVDAVVKVTTAEVLGFSRESAIDVFCPQEAFVLPEAEWTGVVGTLR